MGLASTNFNQQLIVGWLTTLIVFLGEVVLGKWVMSTVSHYNTIVHIFINIDIHNIYIYIHASGFAWMHRHERINMNMSSEYDINSHSEFHTLFHGVPSFMKKQFGRWWRLVLDFPPGIPASTNNSPLDDPSWSRYPPRQPTKSLPQSVRLSRWFDFSGFFFSVNGG